MIEYQRQPNESYDDWKFRLIIGKLEKEIDLDWVEIRDLLGMDCSPDHLRKISYGYRDAYLYFKEKKLNDSNEDFLIELEEKQRYLLKEKMRYQDQKREYTNLLRQQARFEHLKEEIHKSIQELAQHKPLQFTTPLPYPTNKKAIALFSDWHYGSDFVNSINTYNPTVFRQRVEKLTSKLLQYCKKNEINTLYLGILGDMISGLIHVSTRVQASEDLIKQIQVVSEVLAEVITKLANEIPFVKVINVIGNHARLVPNKSEAIIRENFEYLIPWYLESRLKDKRNVEIFQDTDGYFIEEIDGEKFVFVHGDFDNVASVAKNFPQFTGVIPKYIFAGHIHHNHVKEHGRTTVIVNGSLCGADDYAVSKRLFAEPMQKLMILDGTNIECSYDILLN